MKKYFAFFCALCLMPTFSTQAWIGGPFSSNTYFGETGADGVYEASASAVNGLGMFRIVVGNDFQGINPTGVAGSGNAVTPDGSTGRPIDYDGIKSGNVVFGAYGSTWSNLWYYQGVTYRGRTIGTANPVSGQIVGIAEAYSTSVVRPVQIPANPFGVPPTPQLNQDLTPIATMASTFRASMLNSGDLVAGRPFRGAGRARISFVTGLQSKTFRFSVFGSKVSDSVFLGL